MRPESFSYTAISETTGIPSHFIVCGSSPLPAGLLKANTAVQVHIIFIHQLVRTDIDRFEVNICALRMLSVLTPAVSRKIYLVMIRCDAFSTYNSYLKVANIRIFLTFKVEPGIAKQSQKWFISILLPLKVSNSGEPKN